MPIVLILERGPKDVSPIILLTPNLSEIGKCTPDQIAAADSSVFVHAYSGDNDQAVPANTPHYYHVCVNQYNMCDKVKYYVVPPKAFLS